MRTLLCVLMLVGLAQSAAITWTAADSANDTKWSNDANWSTATKPGSTDTAIFDATGGSKAPTIDVSPSIAAVRITSAYTRAWSLSGRTLTVSNGFSDDGITGAHNYGNGITCNGASSTFHTNSTGTNTASSCDLVLNGTTGMILDIDATCLFKSVQLGASAVVTYTGSSGNEVSGGLVLGNNCTFTNNASFRLVCNSATPITIGTGVTLNGTGAMWFRTGSATAITLPAMTFTGTVQVLNYKGVAGAFAITLGGALGMNGALTNRCQDATGAMSLTTGNYPITAAAFTTGNQTASASFMSRYGSSVVTISSYDGATYNTASTIDSFQTSTWSCGGNWTHGSNHTVVPGTYAVTFTGAATILTNAKPFYDITFNAGAGVKDSIADSLICHNLTLTTGKLKGLSQGGNCSGNMTLGGADTVFGRMASSKWWTFPNVSTWQQTNTNRFRLIDSTKWDFTSGGSWLQDSNNTVQRIRLSSGAGGKKLVFQAGKTLTIVRPSNGDFSGTSAASRDSLVSSSAGNAAYLSYSATHIDSFTYLKDIKVIGPTFICTTGCVNGGNDSNITFPTTSTTTSTEQKSAFYTKPVYRKSYKKEPFKNESYYR